jgi:hypothetical protein
MVTNTKKIQLWGAQLKTMLYEFFYYKNVEL